ncbi:S1 RNA-binding domain-containing protein [Amycolatopsis sp. cg5]|uniref:S1 RNA-binding domain-containing protein n=1 Tax=Amycolatopsis sp. cg5 TaxID=3238802 RepID=UPI0035250BAE
MSPTQIPLPVWQDFVARHSAGGVLDGLVTQVLPFGAFVEVADGVQGLLPSVATERGARIAVKIDRIDVENRRFSLVQA